MTTKSTQEKPRRKAGRPTEYPDRVSTTIRLSRAQFERLGEICNATGNSQSVQIGELIDRCRVGTRS